jgi:hypothetical protein
MSHTLKWLVGQFGGVQRSLIFIYVELEQGPNSLYIAPDRHTRQAINQTCSSRKAIFLIFTSTALDGRPALKLTIRKDSSGPLCKAVHRGRVEPLADATAVLSAARLVATHWRRRPTTASRLSNRALARSLLFV